MCNVSTDPFVMCVCCLLCAHFLLGSVNMCLCAYVCGQVYVFVCVCSHSATSLRSLLTSLKRFLLQPPPPPNLPHSTVFFPVPPPSIPPFLLLLNSLLPPVSYRLISLSPLLLYFSNPIFLSHSCSYPLLR